MGLSYNKQNPNGQDALLVGVRDRGNHISGNWDANLCQPFQQKISIEVNEVELRLNLDLMDEKREHAQVCQAAYKYQVNEYFNRIVKHKSF